MTCDGVNGIRIKLLEEAIWSNGDKLSGILEHLVALENELIKIRRSLDHSAGKQSEFSDNELDPTDE